MNRWAEKLIQVHGREGAWHFLKNYKGHKIPVAATAEALLNMGSDLYSAHKKMAGERGLLNCGCLECWSIQMDAEEYETVRCCLGLAHAA